MSFLANISIIKKLAFITLVPILVILFFQVDKAQQLLNLSEQNEITLKIVELSLALDNVAHQHAVERGLTAGFLGSGGTHGRGKVDAQRVNADQAGQALESFITSHSAFLKHNDIDLTEVTQLLSDKKNIRANVDNLSRDNNAFNYYSSLNAAALGIISAITQDIDSAEIRQNLAELNHLLWMKERAGQSRGMLNGIFASGTANEEKFAKVYHFISSHNQHLSALLNNSNGYVHSAVKELTQSDSFLKVENIEARFLQQSHSLKNIQGPSADSWFPLATQRIKAVKQILDQLKEHIEAQALQQIAAANQALISSIILVAIVIFGLLTMGYLMGRSISARVINISDTLHRSIQDKNLTITIDEIGSDEITRISQGINHYIIWLKSLIENMLDLSKQLEKQSHIFTAKSSDNMAILRDQQQQTNMIASAITEMSASIGEVACACQAAANLAQEAQDSGHESNQLAQHSAQNANELSQSMAKSETIINELSSNSQSIGGILDTIRGIAEQTNLLALNAAIEAARAGEQGRGFAVVADEVRSLAQRTQESTEEIQQMITVLQTSADQATHTLHQSQEAVMRSIASSTDSADKIHSVNELTEQMSGQMGQISVATEEQSAVSNEIATNVEKINTHAEETILAAQATHRASQELSSLVTELRSSISQFKVG